MLWKCDSQAFKANLKQLFLFLVSYFEFIQILNSFIDYLMVIGDNMKNDCLNICCTVHSLKNPHRFVLISPCMVKL